jgi:hypothetical protein
MEVAQVQVKEDLQQYTRSSKKRLASQLSDNEGNPGISQIVNLSENEESDSGSSESSKDRSIYNVMQYKIFLSVTYF